MANTTKKPAAKVPPKASPKVPLKVPPAPKSAGKVVKILIVLLVLLILAGIGFALGVYLKMVNIDNLANDLKLADYPIIGQYFSKAKTNFEPVELPAEPEQPAMAPVVVPSNPANQQLAGLPEEKKVLDEKELEKQMKLKQQEDNKRISKSARLYGAMKPEEAVPILNQMDDDTVLTILNKMEDEQVAKILALFDARRSANLTEQMIRGKNSN